MAYRARLSPHSGGDTSYRAHQQLRAIIKSIMGNRDIEICIWNRHVRQV